MSIKRFFILAMKKRKDCSLRKIFFPISNMYGNIIIILFFDCCLSSSSTQTNESTQVDIPSPPTTVFKLWPPVKCLVANVTATSDRVDGGFWTRTLCEKLKEPLSLTTILDQTHEVVFEKFEGEQLSHYESCLGTVYLKGNIAIITNLIMLIIILSLL